MSDDTKMIPGAIRFGPGGDEPRSRSEYRAITSLSGRIKDLESALASARSEVAEWKRSAGCRPSCTIACCDQDCDNAGMDEATGMSAWDALDAARSEVEALRAERDEAVRSMERTGFALRAAEATTERLRVAGQAVVDAYRACRAAGSMAGFWTHLDDLAAELNGRALAASPGKEPTT